MPFAAVNVRKSGLRWAPNPEALTFFSSTGDWDSEGADGVANLSQSRVVGLRPRWMPNHSPDSLSITVRTTFPVFWCVST